MRSLLGHTTSPFDFWGLPGVHGRHSTTPTLQKAAFGVLVNIGPIMYVEAEMRVVTGVMAR